MLRWFSTIRRAVCVLCACIAVAAAVIFATGTAQAEEWSFEDHPQPPYEQYTKKELGYLDEADKDGCEASVEAEYRIYRERYPEFEKSGDTQSNFEKWKRYLVYSSKKYIPECMFIEDAFKMYDLLGHIPPAGFIYCGHKLGAEEIRKYPSATEQLAKVIDYANSGRYSAVVGLLNLSKYEPHIHLNRDVEYYFRKLVRSDFEFEKNDMDTRLLAPLLRADRKAFLNRAAETHNLQAVAATTAPCKP